jgi:probable rRNA maturation factor
VTAVARGESEAAECPKARRKTLNGAGYQIAIIRRSPARSLSDARIRRAVRHVLQRHRVHRCDLEVVILGETGIRRLNERWLGHEGLTDVITFDLGTGRGRRPFEVVGQVNVCGPVARREAARRGVKPSAELLLYVVHGLLHLLGYDDGDPAGATRMHRKEDELLGQLGYGRVYAASGRQRKRTQLGRHRDQ